MVETGVHADAHPCPGESPAHFSDNAPQRRHDSAIAAHGSRAQSRMEQVLIRRVVDRDETEQRQEAVRVVEAVEHRQLLPTVCRVNGRIEVERDDLRLGVALREATDHELLQLSSHVDDLSGRRRVLESRDRRLRGESVLVARIAPGRQLHHRIVAQVVRVDAVSVAHGQPECLLPEQFRVGERDLPTLAIVAQGRQQRCGQPDLPVQGRQQRQAAVRAQRVRVELHVDGLAEDVFEQNRLSCTIGHSRGACFGAWRDLGLAWYDSRPLELQLSCIDRGRRLSLAPIAHYRPEYDMSAGAPRGLHRIEAPFAAFPLQIIDRDFASSAGDMDRHRSRSAQYNCHAHPVPPRLPAPDRDPRTRQFFGGGRFDCQYPGATGVHRYIQLTLIRHLGNSARVTWCVDLQGCAGLGDPNGAMSTWDRREVDPGAGMDTT